MSGTMANAIPPIPLRFEGAENVQSTIDAIVQRINTLESAAKSTSGTLGGLRTQAEATGGAFRNVGSMIGQAGYQVQDFAVQVASGQSALTAFVQQGSQLAGIFGPAGVIVGAGLAIGGIAAQLLMAGNNAKRMGELASEATRSIITDNTTWAASLREINSLYLTTAEAAAQAANAARQLRLDQAMARSGAILLQQEDLGGRQSATQIALDRANRAMEDWRLTNPGLNPATLNPNSTQGQIYARLQLQLQQQQAAFDQIQNEQRRLSAAQGEAFNAIRAAENAGLLGAVEYGPPGPTRRPGGGSGRFQDDPNWRDPDTGLRAAPTALLQRLQTQRDAEDEKDREKRERDYLRELERQEAANQRVTDRIVDYGASAFADMFAENGRGFEGMMETFQKTATRTFARIAAEAVIRPLVEPIVSSLGLGSLGSGNGGLSGLFGGRVSSGSASTDTSSTGGGGSLLSGLGSYVSNPIYQSGFGWFQPNYTGSIASLNAASSAVPWMIPSVPEVGSSGILSNIGGVSLGTYAAAIGGGYMTGSMLGSYLATSPARQQNSQIGAGGGAMAGALAGAAIGGPAAPITAVIGGLIGGLAGGAGGSLIGPGKGFSGGDVGVAVDANGYLTLGNVGGKNWNGGDARNQTSAGLESINAMLRSSGVTITGMGTGTLGYQGYGGSKNTFGPTEIWNRVSGGLTTSNSTLAAALGQGWMQSFEDLSVIAPYAAQNDNLTRALGSGAIRSRDDFNTASQWITSIYEPMVKAAQVGNQWDEALRQQNAAYDEAINKARELGLAESDLASARAKAEAETYRQRDTAVHNALASLGIDEFTAAGNTRGATIASFNLESGNRLTSLQQFLTTNGLGEGTPEYASATSRLTALIEQQRQSMLESFATSLRDATNSLRIGELQAGTPAQQRQAQLLQFDLSAEQQRTGLLGTLRNAGFSDDSSRSTTLIERLNALLETQRKTLVDQLSANDNRANSGTGMLQDLLFGEASGMSSGARFAGGVGALANIKRTGNLDDYVTTAQRFLPVARDHLGTSERYGDLVSSIRKDIVALGGDPTGLMQSIDYQSRTATGVEAMVLRQGATLDEMKALRREMASLGAQVSALVRRVA